MLGWLNSANHASHLALFFMCTFCEYVLKFNKNTENEVKTGHDEHKTNHDGGVDRTFDAVVAIRSGRDCVWFTSTPFCVSNSPDVRIKIINCSEPKKGINFRWSWKEHSNTWRHMVNWVAWFLWFLCAGCVQASPLIDDRTTIDFYENEPNRDVFSAVETPNHLRVNMLGVNARPVARDPSVKSVAFKCFAWLAAAFVVVQLLIYIMQQLRTRNVFTKRLLDMDPANEDDPKSMWDIFKPLI